MLERERFRLEIVVRMGDAIVVKVKKLQTLYRYKVGRQGDVNVLLELCGESCAHIYAIMIVIMLRRRKVRMLRTLSGAVVVDNYPYKSSQTFSS